MSLVTRLLIRNKKIFFGMGLLLLALSTFTFAGPSLKASAQDCDNNAIIHCGFNGSSDFISKVNQNHSGNGHNDLKAIYAYYGLEPASYDRFVTSARAGTAYKNGTIVVDGQTVATNAKSVGRLASFQGSGYFTTPSIPGAGVFYGNVNQKAFASTTSSIPVMVLFNSQGVMEFAVMTSCGNPTYGTNVVPNYSCNALNKTPVSGQLNTYSFSTSASAGNNAAISKVVYNFGDGSSVVSETSPTTAVQHTYTKPGTYTATVTVYVTLPGNQTITVTSVKCSTVITVQAPYYACVQLTGAFLDDTKKNFSFTVTANYGNGASFTGADFDFGDGNSTKGLKPNGSSTSITTDHMYTTAGNYTAIATLHFSVNGSPVTDVKCQAAVTPTQPPTPECKPGVPVGSALCSTCASNSSLPSNSPQCATPAATLVNTGPGQVIGIFGAVAVVGFFLYRRFIYKNHGFAMNGAGAGMPSDVPDMKEPAEHHDPMVPRHDARGPLSHPTYRRPHRFHPRSHHDSE